MTDPRGKVACPKLIDRNNRIQAEKKGFFSALGNIGKIKALEDLGILDNGTRQGLIAIAEASNIIRAGSGGSDGIVGALLRTATEATEAGADIVLNATGIGRVGLDAVNSIDASVANRALGAAKSVFAKAKTGEFSITDIPSYVSDISNLESFLGGIFHGGTDNKNGPLSRFKCQPSPYALDLIHRAPRMKFWYMVDIKFASPYKDYDKVAAGLAFITKSATRPQVDFEYEEVNMYNYRTQVIKRTQFQPIQLRFIDDSTGNALRFYELYLKTISPITSFNPSDPTNIGSFEENSMNFQGSNPVSFSERFPDNQLELDDGTNNPSISDSFADAKASLVNKANGIKSATASFFGNKQAAAAAKADSFSPASKTTVTLPRYASTVGALQSSNLNGAKIYPKNLLESITIYHFGDYGDSISSFTMYNPKITSFQPDELTMSETGEGSELMFEFSYDSLYVTPNQRMADFGSDRLFGLSGGNVGATYPIFQTGVGEGPGSQAGNNLGEAAGASILQNLQAQDAATAYKQSTATPVVQAPTGGVATTSPTFTPQAIRDDS